MIDTALVFGPICALALLVAVVNGVAWTMARWERRAASGTEPLRGLHHSPFDVAHILHVFTEGFLFGSAL